MVDALAITGDEGRGSLRKGSGSWQTSFDPGMSEWGNPPLHRWLSRCAAPQKASAEASMVVSEERVMCEGELPPEYIGWVERTPRTETSK